MRDQLWTVIAAFAFAGSRTLAEVQAETGEADLPAALTERVATADHVADERFVHAAVISRHAALRQQLEAHRAEERRLRTALEELQVQDGALTDRWRREWPEAGAPAVRIAEAKEWLNLRGELLQQWADWQAADAKPASLADTIERARAEIFGQVV